MSAGAIAKRRELICLYYRKARAQSLARSALTLLKPHRIVFHLGRIITGRTRAWSNFYVPSSSHSEELQFCCAMTGCAPHAAEAAFAELDGENSFVESLRRSYARVRFDSPVPLNLGRMRVWYAIARLVKPELVMETGVHDGLSSALLLLALHKNQRGSLVSIDLPSVDLPIEVAGAGWLVPEELKARWRLHVGDSRNLLPALARQHAPIDIFIHDSDHSAEFQTFEYETVRPFLRNPGLLLTDDADPELFSRLAHRWSTPYHLARGGQIAPGGQGLILGGFRFDGGESAENRQHNGTIEA